MDPGAQIRALRAFSGVRRLPQKEAKILSEEHKAVLLVVIGYRQKGGISKSRVGEILGLKLAISRQPDPKSQEAFIWVSIEPEFPFRQFFDFRFGVDPSIEGIPRKKARL